MAESDPPSELLDAKNRGANGVKRHERVRIPRFHDYITIIWKPGYLSYVLNFSSRSSKNTTL